MDLMAEFVLSSLHSEGQSRRDRRWLRCQYHATITVADVFSQLAQGISAQADEAVLDGSFSLDPIDVLGVPQTYDYFDIPDLFFFEDLCPESTSEVIVSGISPTHMGALEATAAPPEKGNMTSPQHISEADTHYSEPYSPLLSPGLIDAVSVPAYYPQDVHYAYNPVSFAPLTCPHDVNPFFYIGVTFAFVFFSLASARAHAAEVPLHARSSPKTNYSFHQLEAMIAKGSCRCPVDDCSFTPASGKRHDLLRHIKTHCEDKGEVWVCCGSAQSCRVAGTCKPFEYGGQMRVGGCLLSFSRKDALGRHVRDSKNTEEDTADALLSRASKVSTADIALIILVLEHRVAVGQR
ncbi:hypothetical protein IEO21_04904 [Rhodonia placenta]|uniref:Uncharacterized protein n=1 Tax=Rhodonia placenta TaxID=104341 RepID=A0A8H7P2Z5_9APHY|nr:hypothetical protein IEO21_04904 [Postia placenta]